MAIERPTRWQKAREDWPGFEWRDLGIGVVAIVLAVLALLVLGRPGGAVPEVLIVGGAGLLAAILYPLAQLVWAWLQAPMRLLTDDVVAIRERLEQGPPGEPVRPVNVRWTLLDLARQGSELLDYYSGPPTEETKAWTAAAGAFLGEHGEPADAEKFLRGREVEGAEVGSPLSTEMIAMRVRVLEGAADRLPAPGT